MDLKHKPFIDEMCQKLIDYVVEELPDNQSSLERVVLTDDIITGFVMQMIDHISEPDRKESFPMNTINLVTSIMEMAARINHHIMECKHHAEETH